MSKKTLYRINFINHSKIYEIYAKKIVQSEMFGFIEISDFVFGETSKLMVDPAEERLKVEFSDVKRCFIPMDSILRIDEVEKEGIAKITVISDKDSKVTQFPSNIYQTTDFEKK